MAVKHAVIRTDLMAGTKVPAALRSFRYFDSNGDLAEIDNGCVVALDSIIVDSQGNEPNREVWKAVAPTASTPLSKLAIVATPELLYDERLRNLTDFYNDTDHPARGYMPKSGDIFSVTAEALDGTPAKGSGVALQAKVQLKVGTYTAGTSFGKIVSKETVNGLDFFVIQVD